MAFLRKTGFGFRAIRNIIRLKFNLLRNPSNFPPRLRHLRDHYQRHGSWAGAYQYEYQRLQGKTRFDDALFRTDPASVTEIIKVRFPDCNPIEAVRGHHEGLRLNLVTENLDANSFFGVSALSLIWATLAARRHNWPLRIITRQTPGKARHYFELLRLHGLRPPARVEFFSDSERFNGEYRQKLPVSDQDLFLATSWQSAVAIKQTSLRKINYYLAHEAEALAEVHSDEHCRSLQVLNDPTFRFIFSSESIFERFKIQPGGNISRNGSFVEPAFPIPAFAPGKGTFAEKEKFLLFFYANPRAPRTFFFTGLERLDHALKANLLPQDNWEIICAGTEMPDIRFSNGVVAKNCGVPAWDEYSALARRVDLAFHLSQTPHPCCAPLDMVAFGAVALTNRPANQQMPHYSENIIYSDLEPSAMLAAFEEASNLAKNVPVRKANYLKNRFVTSWEESCAKSLAFLEANL